MDTRPTRTIIEEFVEKQGWSDTTVITLLCEYLDLLADDPRTLEEFLQEKANADTQNSEE